MSSTPAPDGGGMEFMAGDIAAGTLLSVAANPMLPRVLMAASAVMMLIVGALHLHGTFLGRDLRPRDAGLEARMKEVSPNITDQTTMWQAWLGFNAVVGLGLMLFGVLYCHLIIFRDPLLLHDRFLQLAATIFLAGLVEVARRFLFDIPVAVFTLALVLHVAGAALTLF